MKVIVDTCIWSQVIRRKKTKNEKLIHELTELIKDVRIQMIGPIRQEILSGINTKFLFNKVKVYFAAFPDLDLNTIDYEFAAEFYNICRKKGIQGSNTDFLICASAVNWDYEIFTTDKDFISFQRFLPIRLYNY